LALSRVSLHLMAWKERKWCEADRGGGGARGTEDNHLRREPIRQMVQGVYPPPPLPPHNHQTTALFSLHAVANPWQGFPASSVEKVDQKAFRIYNFFTAFCHQKNNFFDRNGRHLNFFISAFEFPFCGRYSLPVAKFFSPQPRC
jgi:hypothetical protein